MEYAAWKLFVDAAEFGGVNEELPGGVFHAGSTYA